MWGVALRVEAEPGEQRLGLRKSTLLREFVLSGVVVGGGRGELVAGGVGV